MVAFGDERPESGCLYSRSVEGSRDKTRCSTLCRDKIHNSCLLSSCSKYFKLNESVNNS